MDNLTKQDRVVRIAEITGRLSAIEPKLFEDWRAGIRCSQWWPEVQHLTDELEELTRQERMFSARNS